MDVQYFMQIPAADHINMKLFLNGAIVCTNVCTQQVKFFPKFVPVNTMYDIAHFSV